MSVGTNEDIKNINENIENVDELENAVNTGGETVGGSVNNVVDMEATQRINFLGGLQRDSEITAKKIIKNRQGNFAPCKKYKCVVNDGNNEKNIELENVENSGSEVSNEPIAQAENLSAVNVSDENVQETPNEKLNIENTQSLEVNEIQNDADEIIVRKDRNQDKTNEEQNVEIIENVEQEEIENVSDQEDVVKEVKESEEEIAKKKEKQHAQDKKDFRLERMLFARINTMQGKIKESLELIQKYERIEAKEGNLPNIVTTLHDKLTQEVIKQFRTVGIEFNMKSFLVQSIVSDLLSKFEEGITEFRNCSENLNFVREVQEDFESRVELAPTSKVKNFFARIRGIFKPERKQEKLEQLERERQEQKLEKANIYLIKYKFINSELAKYTIKNNIVNSLTKEILHGQGSGLTLNVKEFIDEKIAPEMKKLGLENLLPELEERIYEEYNQRHNVTKEEFEGLSVGELRKNMKFQKADIAINKVMKVVAANKAGVNTDNEEAEEKVAM